jgi:hypothetical protein
MMRFSVREDGVAGEKIVEEVCVCVERGRGGEGEELWC